LVKRHAKIVNLARKALARRNAAILPVCLASTPMIRRRIALDHQVQHVAGRDRIVEIEQKSGRLCEQGHGSCASERGSRSTASLATSLQTSVIAAATSSRSSSAVITWYEFLSNLICFRREAT